MVGNKGFLRTKGRKIVTEAGEEILLRGWGIGNWLLPEGYMWEYASSKRFDRPQRIQAVIEELLGKEQAQAFWDSYYEQYITEKDIEYMKQQGYNSVRLPIHWKLFMEDGSGISFIESGFELLEKFVVWCETHELYVWIDLHGAPGGQTGANIDDSVDDIPRLFIDQDKWDKGLALWEEIARRYADREIIAGYDLLNEPIRPGGGDLASYDHLLGKLSEFYDAAIARIRKHDPNHMVALEGHHWATDTSVFNKKYDDNFVIHFHRYANLPQIEAFQEFLEASERWNVPLWLGETGENLSPWFAAMVKICEDHHISYHFWTYKKMGRKNCSVNIRTPKDWDQVIAYANGGPHPGYAKAAEIFAEYLENLAFEKGDFHPEVDRAILRKVPFVYRATDFDEVGSKGISQVNNLFSYRWDTGITITEERPLGAKRFSFDNQWDRLCVNVLPEDFVSYSINDCPAGTVFELAVVAGSQGELEIFQDESLRQKVIVDPATTKISVPLQAADNTTVRVVGKSGVVLLSTIGFV